MVTFEGASTLTGIQGRLIARAGDSHFVIDRPAFRNGPGEAPNPGEVFVSGVTGCAALVADRIAREREFPLEAATVKLVANRELDTVRDGLSIFESARITFTLKGVSAEQAETLIAEFQAQCPLYGAMKLGTTEMVVDYELEQ